VTAPKAPRLDARQHFDWIPLSEIENAPTEWGRPIKVANVRAIAAVFDPDAMGSVCIWHRPDRQPGRGRYVTVDGQHRVAALRLWLGDAGDQRVPALMYEGLTMETAAELSLALQDRRNLHPLDRHHAAVAAHDRRAVDIDKVLEHLRLTLVYSCRADERFHLSAVAMLGYIWDCTGGAGVERVLTICGAAWENTSAGYSGSVLKLVMYVVAAHNGEVRDEQLVRALATRSPGQWIAKDVTPRRPLQSIAQDVIIEYNKRTRGAGRLAELTPSAYVAAGKRKPARTKRGKVDAAKVTKGNTSAMRHRRGPGRYSSQR